MTFPKCKFNLILVAILLVFLGSSCVPNKYLAPDQLRVKSHVVKIKKNRILVGELTPFCRPFPPRKMLGIPFREFFYLKAANGDSRFWDFFNRKKGKEPLYYSPTWVGRTREYLKQEMNNRGYYRARIQTEIKKPRFIGKKRNRIVVHNIVPGNQFRVFDYQIQFDDPVLEEKLERYNPDIYTIHSGKPFTRSLLENERSRIVKAFHNLGYYQFSSNHVKFIADTLQGNSLVDLTLQVSNPISGGKHRIFRIRDIVVEIDPLLGSGGMKDSLLFNEVLFLYPMELPIRPEILLKQITIKERDFLLLRNTESTYRNLTKLGVFQSISVRFIPIDGVEGEMDCRVVLKPSTKYSASMEARVESRIGEWKNNNYPGANFGISGRVSLEDRNLFRGGENLSLSLGGGLEPFLITDSLSNQDNGLLNTFEFGPMLKLRVPKLLLPGIGQFFDLDNKSRTDISLSYNVLSNLDLKRQELKVDYNFNWTETEGKQHELSPITISSIKVDPSPALSATLEQIKDPFLTNAYRDHLIISSSYGYYFNRRAGRKAYLLHAEVEGAGNLLNQFAEEMSLPENELGNHEIGKIPFAQFLKTDGDMRLYLNRSPKNQWAFRLFAGLGFPTGGTKVLPFQKSYFGGGANGIRAWKARSLGPGSYADTLSLGANFDRIGDIRLEGNMEFRFDITSIFEGAIFADIGNVWTLNPIESRENGSFGPQFYKDLAVGTGFGTRLDFDFFILRLDLGFRVRDPGLKHGEKWFFQPKSNFNASVKQYNLDNGSNLGAYHRQSFNISFGIGYPF